MSFNSDRMKGVAWARLRIGVALPVLAVAVLLSATGPGRRATLTAAGADESRAIAANRTEETAGSEKMSEKMVKTEAEWRELLTPEQYHVTREKGTERAFTGENYYNKEPGQYVCVGCGTPLFSSKQKFESGTGWPSFWDRIDPDSVATAEDRRLLTTRTEVLCSRCDAHLGHVFDDGPQPTGKRYCINSVALDFVPGSEAD